jgi:hypothetical protein
VQTIEGIQLTINAIATALWNSVAAPSTSEPISSMASIRDWVRKLPDVVK